MRMKNDDIKPFEPNPYTPYVCYGLNKPEILLLSFSENKNQTCT